MKVPSKRGGLMQELAYIYLWHEAVEQTDSSTETPRNVVPPAEWTAPIPPGPQEQQIRDRWFSGAIPALKHLSQAMPKVQEADTSLEISAYPSFYL